MFKIVVCYRYRICLHVEQSIHLSGMMDMDEISIADVSSSVFVVGLTMDIALLLVTVERVSIR